jgi:transcriptional/translational regulatory protein YebC/TACO1
MVEAATDNRNRTAQELKNLFERSGGSLGGPGSVSFNFDKKGLVVVAKKEPLEEQLLTLIDLGAQNVEDTASGVEVFVSPSDVGKVASAVRNAGFEVLSADLVLDPKTYTKIDSPTKASKALSFLDKLEDLDDVQKVFANVDISEDIISQIVSE